MLHVAYTIDFIFPALYQFLKLIHDQGLREHERSAG